MSSYDQSLLGEAPKATRAQLQEGYNVDLLEQPADAAPRRTPSLRSPTPHISPSGPAAIAVPLTPAIAENASGEKFDSPAPVPAPSPKASFWRTRNGIITLTVLALVVVGAVVGGAVGGTVGKKSSSNSVASTKAQTTATTTSAPATTVTQGAAGQATASQQIAEGTSRPAGFASTTTSSSSSSTAKASATATGGNIG